MQTDVNLQRDVLDELDWEPSLDAAHIGVTVNEGVVTLTGHLPVYSQKHTADQVAKRVHGVRAVANEIEVRLSGAHVRDDEDIATAAVHALHWDAKVPDEQLQVTVEDGWVTVEGTVEEQFQRVEVERVVRHLAGVRGVTNSVTVAPRERVAGPQADVGRPEGDIEAALQRSAALRPREISVEMDGTTVVLTGDVHSLAELEEAVRIAWSARGVRDVENCITVTPWGTGPSNEWGY